jgi:hypothetical protein
MPRQSSDPTHQTIGILGKFEDGPNPERCKMRIHIAISKEQRSRIFEDIGGLIQNSSGTSHAEIACKINQRERYATRRQINLY